MARVAGLRSMRENAMLSFCWAAAEKAVRAASEKAIRIFFIACQLKGISQTGRKGTALAG